MLDRHSRYLQIAFNYNLAFMLRILPRIARSKRILIEAGAPYIKREGMDGVEAIRRLWQDHIVADLRAEGGELVKVDLAREAGATAVTALGSAPREVLDYFIARCAELGMDSMIDMDGVDDPADVLTQLRRAPDVVVLHRDQEDNGTGCACKPTGERVAADCAGDRVITQHSQVDRLETRFDVLVSTPGAIDLEGRRERVPNHSGILVIDLVRPSDAGTGGATARDVWALAKDFVATTEQPKV
jgi:3-keto-L-gulonate-6-phosphate decarboxylase